MSNDRAERTFPAIRLAETVETASPIQERMELLKQLSVRLDEHHVFTKGQFVRWKPGLKNKRYPDYDEPAIVMSVLQVPTFDPEATASTPYFQEPLNLVIGVFLEDDLLEYRVDQRRFEPIRP